MKEKFKDIAGFEGLYQVSNFGNVKSFIKYKGTNERILKPGYDGDGYGFVYLYNKHKASMRKIHRLVALTFIPNPENKPQVNHINGIKLDNRVENLEWNTRSENMQHAFTTGLNNSLHLEGEKNNRAKLTESEVLQIRDLKKSKRFINREIAEFYNCDTSNINYVVNRKIWKHI